jgi:hypothetical protein
MPDITMCTGGDCVKRHSCFRNRAKPNHYQSYMMPPPNNGDNCEHYWKFKDDKELAELNKAHEF